MKKTVNGFWIFYIIWVTANIALLAVAVFHTTNDFIQSVEKFWPFTVGLQASNLLELFVYLNIPLLIYFIYRFTYHHVKREKTDTAQALKSESQFEEII
jgi:hypothetical protein